MSLQDELVDRERGFWAAAGDGDFYRANMADDGICLLPVGAMDKASTVDAIAETDPWQSYDFDEVEVRMLADGAAMLTYRARASRADDNDYRALVSTLYRNDGSVWKLLTHQQTPLQSA